MSLLPPATVTEDFSLVLQSDECPVVRHEAAYYLGTTHSERAVKALGESMLNDPDELVRHEAAEALGELGLPSGEAWLRHASADPSSLVRRTVEIALQHIALKSSDLNHNTYHRSFEYGMRLAE
jgi:deoxyhypusine monooxygenase